jgi:hypothetical protein
MELFISRTWSQAAVMSNNDIQTEEVTSERKKGPISFLSGSLTSLMLSWLSFGLSKGMIAYFAKRPPSFSSPIAQSIASAIKTLFIGMCFLATFSFAFIGIGLFLVFIRSLFTSKEADTV